jgi:hypothetical protein
LHCRAEQSRAEQYSLVQRNTEEYREIQGNTGEYRAFQGIPGNYSALQGNTGHYKALRRQLGEIQDWHSRVCCCILLILSYAALSATAYHMLLHAPPVCSCMLLYTPVCSSTLYAPLCSSKLPAPPCSLLLIRYHVLRLPTPQV